MDAEEVISTDTKKFCECGCGEEIPLFTKHKTREIARFKHGHNRKGKPAHPNSIHRGEKHPNWKGGKFLNYAGYVYVLCPTHPYRNRAGYVFEHRLVMEQHLGRYLRPDEDVHHINEIKTDNRIENLKLTKHSEHTSIHNPKIDMSQRICCECGLKSDEIAPSNNGQPFWVRGFHDGEYRCKSCYMRDYYRNRLVDEADLRSHADVSHNAYYMTSLEENELYENFP